MEDDRLFIRVYDDLEQRLESKDVYDLLNISRLLRQLLLDGSALIYKVNRKRRIQVQFQITDLKPPTRSSVTFWNIGDGIDPQLEFPGASTQSVKLAKFLKTVMIRSQGYDFTIDDLIRFVANVMGGVHSGDPTSEIQRRLLEIDKRFVIWQPDSEVVSLAISQLRAITRVVLRGLQPLRDAVLGDI